MPVVFLSRHPMVLAFQHPGVSTESWSSSSKIHAVDSGVFLQEIPGATHFVSSASLRNYNMGFHVPLTSCIFHACKTSTTSLTLPSPAASLGWSLVTLNQSCISLHVLTLGRHFPWGLFSMENPSPSILHGLPPSEKFTSLLLQCSLVSNGADLFNDYDCLQTAWSMKYKLAALFSLPDCRVFILLLFYLSL